MLCAAVHFLPLLLFHWLRRKGRNCCALQFISRPFVVGDRIEISSVGGSKFVVGVVERVDPMRTIIRTDSCMPITIPNKVGTISSQNALQRPDRLLHAYHHFQQGWCCLFSTKSAGNACKSARKTHAYRHLDRLLYAYHHDQQGWYYLFSTKLADAREPAKKPFASLNSDTVMLFLMMHKQFQYSLAHGCS